MQGIESFVNQEPCLSNQPVGPVQLYTVPSINPSPSIHPQALSCYNLGTRPLLCYSSSTVDIPVSAAPPGVLSHCTSHYHPPVDPTLRFACEWTTSSPVLPSPAHPQLARPGDPLPPRAPSFPPSWALSIHPPSFNVPPMSMSISLPFTTATTNHTTRPSIASFHPPPFQPIYLFFLIPPSQDPHSKRINYSFSFITCDIPVCRYLRDIFAYRSILSFASRTTFLRASILVIPQQSCFAKQTSRTRLGSSIPLSRDNRKTRRHYSQVRATNIYCTASTRSRTNP